MWERGRRRDRNLDKAGRQDLVRPHSHTSLARQDYADVIEEGTRDIRLAKARKGMPSPGNRRTPGKKQWEDWGWSFVPVDLTNTKVDAVTKTGGWRGLTVIPLSSSQPGVLSSTH